MAMLKYKKLKKEELISTERYTPQIESLEISYEHWHRYLSITPFIKGKKVLDVGCGEGYGTNLIAKYAARAVGVDIDEKVILKAQKKYKKRNLKFMTGRASNLQIEKNNAFDIVVSFETIEHLTAKKQQEFLTSVKGVLRKNGQFIVSTPDKKNYSDVRNYQNPYHKKEFYKEEFIKFLKNYFKYVNIFGQKIYPASFIWNENGLKGNLGEYFISKNKKGFSAEFFKKREPLMLIALCSEVKIKDFLDSYCLDLDEVFIKEKVKELNILKKMITQKDKYIESLSGHLDQKTEELKEIYNS